MQANRQQGHQRLERQLLRLKLQAPVAHIFPAAAAMPLVGLGTWTQRHAGEVKVAVQTASGSAVQSGLPVTARGCIACAADNLGAAASTAAAASFLTTHIPCFLQANDTE